MENTNVTNQTGSEPKVAVVAAPQPMQNTQASELSPLSVALKRPLRTPLAASVPQQTLSLSVKFITVKDKVEVEVPARESTAIKVSLVGAWEGKWVKAVIRQIEREYRLIKNNATRKVVQQSADDRRVVAKTKE